MESVLSRYRNLIILVGVLFLQVLGLAMQVKRSNNEARDTRLIRIWAVGAITPFERALVSVQSSTASVWHNYVYLRGVRAQNRELRDQIEQMRLEQVRLSEDAAQARRLQILLAFKEQFIAKTVAAQVIGSSGSDTSRVVYIDKGEKAGIKPDMAVITADGIVGKVLLVYPSVSQVLLINDQSSGVGAILEKSRLQGVLRGTVNGEVELEKLMSDEQVPVGERVLTSGGDQIFPKGLPIGTVANVKQGKDLFLDIKIKPAASLSKLEEVLVLVEKQDRQAVADDNAHMRAADILAQRLPSVPDKPAGDVNASGAPAGERTKPAGTAASVESERTGSHAASHAVTNPSAAKVVGGPVAPKQAAVQAKAPEKQKTDGSTTKVAKPATVPAKPSVTEQQAPPAAQPNSQQAAPDNTPN